MSYYMGDYRRGDYYPVGDPGIGSFFRSALGLIPGVGGIVQKATGVLSKLGHHPAAAGVTAAAQAAKTAIVKHPVLSAAGAAGALAGAESMMKGGMFGAGGACPKGHHMSKHHGKKGPAPHCVRNRRMNFANPRALRRATRRLHAFARHYRKVVGFVSPKRPKGRMYFKRKKKAA